MDTQINMPLQGTGAGLSRQDGETIRKTTVRDRLPVPHDPDRFEQSGGEEAPVSILSHGKAVHVLEADSLKNKAIGLLKKGFFHVLGIRFPHTAKKLSEEQKKEIREALKPGDIILTMSPGYPGWQVLEEVTARSCFTHAALYEGDGKILETLSSDGVARTELEDTLNDAALIEVLRPPYKTPEDRDAVISYSRSKMGRSYDYGFNTNDDNELYCSEMIYWALKSMQNPIEVKGNHFMGHYIVSPQAMESIPDSKVIFSTGASFLKGLSFYSPVYAGTIAGAVGGAALMGPVGLIGGAALGWAASVLTGNRFQTGKWGFEV